jgi:hypothetical protein
MMGKYGFSFSWKRLLGVTSAKQSFARKTGVPTSKAGMERKIGKMMLQLIFGKKDNETITSLLLT